MGFFMRAAEAAGKIALTATGGPLRRMALGTVAGGIYGGVTSDSANDTGFALDVFKGAAMGLGIGALTTKTALKGLAKNIPKAAWKVGKTAVKKSPSVIGLGVKTASFVGRHPFASVAIAGGAYGLVGTGPNLSSMGEEETNRFAEARGGPSTGTYMGNPVSQSTVGLVQGAHRSRHRG